MINDSLKSWDIWNRWLEAYVKDIQDVGGGMIKGRCPSPDHNDDKPSFSANRDEYWYKCFGCEAKGNPITFAKMLGLDYTPFIGFDFKSGIYNTAEKTPKNNPLKTPNRVNKCRKEEAIKRWDLVPHNGNNVPENWNIGAIEALQVQYSKKEGAIAFPILDMDWNWIEVYCHKPVNKFLGGGKFKCSLYPLHLIPEYKPDVVTYVCEGMKDAVTLLSHGLQVVTSTNGALTIPNDLSPLQHMNLFTHIPDDDEAGYRGQKKWVEALNNVCSHAKVHITDWNELNEGFTVGTDVTDVTSATLYELISTETLYKRGFNTMSVDTLMEADIKLDTYIVEQLLIERGMLLIASTDGVGKSLLGTQLGFSITTGVPFMDDFKVLKPLPVMLIQFELEDGELQRRVRLQSKAFENITVPKPYLFANRDDSEIFRDKWPFIDHTLSDHNFYEGVVIVDNLFTSTELNISDNDELKILIRQIDNVRRKYGTAFVLFGHFIKTEPGQPLVKESVQGGKLLTNSVNNVLLLGISTLNNELRIGKIMKCRSGKSLLEGIPFKMHMDDDTIIFRRGGVIENEKAHLQARQRIPEIEALKLCRPKCTMNLKNNIKTFTFDDYKKAMAEEIGRTPTYDKQVYLWLNKLRDVYKCVRKIGKGEWQPLWENLDEDA